MKRISLFLCVASLVVCGVATAAEEAPAVVNVETSNKHEPDDQPQQNAPAPDKPSDPAPIPKELEQVVEAFKRLKLSGYLQAQYVHDESSADVLTGSASTANRDQFSVRRGRIKITYQLAKTSRFVLQPDISSSGVSLKDGYIELTEPWTSWRNTLTAGQFPWPFGFELGLSSSSREMPERSRVMRALFPGERDRGVMFSGRGFERFVYQAAIVNGTGTTRSFDANKRKDFVGRVGGKFGPVTVGVSAYRGSALIPTANRPAGEEFDKERTGLDVQLVTPLPGLRLRGEYIIGKEKGADVSGWYTYLIQNVGARHQLVARIDTYDPNDDLSNNSATRSIVTYGGAYHFKWDKNSKITLAYEHPELERFDVDDDVATLRYQFSF